MDQCCGKEVESPFCPECGKKLTHINLEGLLFYVQGRQRSAERQLRAAQERGKLRPAPSDEEARAYRERDLKYMAGNIAKWTGWAEQLEEVIKKQADPAQP